MGAVRFQGAKNIHFHFHYRRALLEYLIAPDIESDILPPPQTLPRAARKGGSRDVSIPMPSIAGEGQDGGKNAREFARDP